LASRPAGGQQGEVEVRAEAAVPHQDVAPLEVGVDAADARHLVGAQRGGEDLQQRPGAGVEQGQDPGHREAAPGLGPARGAEVGPQFGRIGHRERGAVDQERAVAVPGALHAGVRDEGLGQATKDGPVDRQREAGSRLAERGVAERAAGHQRDVGQGGVAVQHLDEEPAEDGDGSQQAVAPAVADASAGVVDGGLVEAGGEVLPEATQGGEDPEVHRGPPARWCR
jgi:hypothetical protein